MANCPVRSTTPVWNRLALGLTLVLLLLPGGSRSAGAADPPATVQVTIDYGDGAEVNFPALPWRKKLTVLELLDAVAAHPHGVSYKHRGTGANTFVLQIGDLKNEGGGIKNRNWIFRVNGQQSEVGVGACQVDAGDRVLWKFEVADYNP